jgi:DNA replication and repair protein RecF
MSQIQTISLQNWRKFEQSSWDFQPGINLILGPNAIGKTSVIEAIHFLAHRKSFRTSKTSELIRSGQSVAYILTELTQANTPTSVAVKIPQSGPLQLNINQTPQRKLSTLDSLINCVIFTFADLEIVSGQPSKRREIFDQLLSAHDSNYAQHIRNYKKILETRSQILHRLSQNAGYAPTDPALATINQQLIETGSQIISLRLTHLDSLNRLTNQFYSHFVGALAPINFQYQSSFLLKNLDLTAIQTQFAKVIEFNQNAEIHATRNLFGPHRDDIQMLASGHSTRQFFSLGEQWSLAISLKLTLAEIIEQSTAIVPFLLLDDVFSIIDDSRGQRLIEQLAHFGQVFVTSSRTSNLLTAHSHKIEILQQPNDDEL